MLDIALLALSPLATLQGVAAKVDPLDAIVAEAERDAREGRYDKARAAYQMLAKKHPETIQGILGAKRSRPSAYLGWAPVKESGPSANRVDIVFMGDGWEWQNLKAFDKLAEDAANELARNEVVREYAAYFNFHRAVLVSAQNGVDGFGRDYDTPLGARTLETFAGHVGIDQAKVREVLSEFPAHDGQAIVFVKNGVLGTGGSGVAVIGGREMGTMVHEFGHSFAGLADEYYSSQVAYEQFAPHGVEPWEPNATALLDPARLKWRDLVEPGTPIATPWDQDGYDALDLAYQARRAEALAAGASDERNEELMREIKALTAAQLAKEPWRGRVGAFQGALYDAKRYWRPEVDCIMFSRNPTTFCRVCERALERAIRMYAE